MPRRKEEPEWDTDSDDDGSNGDESGFEDENSEESGSGSDESSKSGSEEGSESGSEEGSESGSEEGSESGSEEDSESGSDSEESDSDDSDEDEESLEDIGFNDEERGQSIGDLMNEPTEDPGWTKLVPAKILAIGMGAAAMFCCCIIFIPILAITIGIAVGVGKGAKEVKAIDVAPIITTAPTATATTATTTSVPISTTPTPSPTSAPVVKATLLRAVASNTIYLEGANAEIPGGQEDFMLVQNGFSNDELPSAYSLVQFDGIIGVDSGTSVDDYLDSIDDLTVEFCLVVFAGNEIEDTATYTTCLLPEVAEGIEMLTGSSDYSIPESCLNQKVVTFEVNPFDEEVCVDIVSLLTDSTNMSEVNTTEVANNTESTDRTPSLRGRRFMEANGANVTYLLMIDSLEESDQPGTRFYSSNNEEGAGPTLGIVGENTCVAAATAICTAPEFQTLCSLVEQAGLTGALSSRDAFEAYTIFAPTNEAFENLDSGISGSLQDVDALTNVLLYHVAPTEIRTSDENFCGASVEMANGGQSTTLCDTAGVYQVGNGASPGVKLPQFISSNLEVCHGVIHMINEVLIPADTENPVSCPPDNEVIDIADLCSQSNSSTFCDLLEKAGLQDVFSGGLYTVFAPTDEAFSAAIQSLDGSVDFEDQNFVRSILLQHVIAGSLVYAQNLNCEMEPVLMANGQYNEISCGNEVEEESEDAFFVSGMKILDTDTIGCTFVLHSIDGVIIPDLTEYAAVDETIVEFLSGAGDDTFSTLLSLFKRINLVGFLADAQGITVVAPTNEAFSELNKTASELFTSLQSDDQYLAHLQSLLLYHVLVSEIRLSETNVDDKKIETYYGEEVAFSNWEFILGEIQVKNGIVQFIDRVLTPSWVDKSIADVIVGLSDLALVYDLLIDANLAEALSGPGPFTVFLPLDSAFDGQFDDVKDLDSESLVSILQNHVVPGIYTSDNISDGLELKTLEGEDILFQKIAGTTTVGGQKIKITDILANNGIIHLIDGLIPGPSEESDSEEPPSEDVIPESAMTPPPTVLEG